MPMPIMDPSMYPDQREEEKRIRESIQSRKDALEREINLGRASLAIQHAPGFKEFIHQVQGLSDRAKRDMVACTAADAHLRVLQGRCQAYGVILGLMRSTENGIENLSQQLEAVRHKAAQSIRPDGKVVPEPLGGINEGIFQ